MMEPPALLKGMKLVEKPVSIALGVRNVVIPPRAIKEHVPAKKLQNVIKHNITHWLSTSLSQFFVKVINQLAMKLTFLVLLLCSNLSASSAQQNDSLVGSNQFALIGRLRGLDSGSIYMVYYNNLGNRLVMHAKVRNEYFKFAGQIRGYSDQVFLKLDSSVRENNDSVNSVQIGIENAIMNIELEVFNFSKYKLTGCSSCNSYKVALKRFNRKPDKAFEVWKTSFIRSHPNDNLAPFLLFWLKNSFASNRNREYISLFDNLDSTQKISYYGQRTKLNVESMLRTTMASNTNAANFSGVSLDGNKFILDSLLKSGMVLLNFWASWCVPCRAESPKLLDLLSRYQDNGFQILAISDDSNEKAWRQAIVKDGIGSFTNALFSKTSIRQWNTVNGISNEYNVYSLPTLILIDKDRRVVGRFNVKELEVELKKIYSL